MKTPLYRTLKMKIIFASALFLASFAPLLLPSFAPAFALDANQQAICDSIGSGTDCGASTHSTPTVSSILNTTINLFSGIVGVVAVIMIVMAGFKYITSGGDSAKLTSAKNTLVYALIGIIIVVLAQSIVRFVLTKTVNSASITCSTGMVPDAAGTKCVPGK